MLESIRITNFILIDELTIEFSPGFTVLTGETGAGKSIILGALAFLFGEKPKTLPLRNPEKDALVEAIFDLTSLSELQKQELPEICQGDSVVVSRSITPNGRGKVLINGNLATITLLQELTAQLVNICGQNQHVKLLHSNYHLSVLDGFAKLDDQLLTYGSLFKEYKSLEQKYVELEERSAVNLRIRQLLEQTVADLGPLKLTAELKSSLETEQRRLSSSEKLLTLSSRFEEQLVKGENGFRGLEKEVRGVLAELAKIDPSQKEIQEKGAEFIVIMNDLEVSLARYLSKIDCDEKRLEEIREQLSSIAKYERKYKTDFEGLIKLYDQSKEDLLSIDDEGYLLQLKKQVTAAKTKAESAAEILSKNRKKAFLDLKQRVEAGLESLHMPGFRIECSFERKELSPQGIDKVEFLIATNPGETPKPLGTIASGGELSRLTLVLKESLRDSSGASVFLFDEVDTGISGKVARAVGEKLKNLSLFSQVLCATHLPQVASLADSHLYVEKEVGDRSTTTVRELRKEERIEEVARMISGERVTKSSRESARELMAS